MSLIFCERYAVDCELEQDIFTFSDQYQLKTYKGIDQIESRTVLIRTLNLSQINDSLRNFAHDFWNYELRVTRQALAAAKGKNITKLVDARYDEKNSSYVLIFDYPGITLKDLFKEQDQLSILFSPEKENRRELWQAFLNLSEALNNLHLHYMLHRNLSLNSIYWDQTSENFAESLSIGNFSLSIYLHSLFQQISSNKKNEIDHPQKRWSIYCAPEIVGISQPKQSYIGENFASDIFSFGVIIAQCLLCQDFDTGSFTSNQDYKEVIDNIIKSVTDANSIFLIEKERTVILKLISLNEKERYQNAADVIEAIKTILLNIKSDEVKIVDIPFPVFFRQDPNKDLFYRDLSESLDLHAIDASQNHKKIVEQWLFEEFLECALYPSIDNIQILWTRGRSGTIYSFKPLVSMSTKQELPVSLIRFERHLASLIPPNNPRPVCYMKKGLEWAQGNFTGILSPWGKAFAKARDWQEKNLQNKWSVEDLFEKRLELMLESEQILESVNVLPFERVPIEKQEVSKIRETCPRGEILKIKILYEKDHPKYGKLKYTPLNTFMEDVVNSSNRRVCLTREYMPFAKIQVEDIWEVIKWNGNDSSVFLYKDASSGENFRQDSGFLRPWSMKLSAQLFYRKKKGIDALLANSQIIGTFLAPRYNVFFPPVCEQTSNIVSKITSTVPIYLIQGPPGTGKTYTAIETIKSILQENPSSRILVSSKEHNALDDLVKKIAKVLPTLDITPEPILLRLISQEKEQEYSKSNPVRKHFGMNVTKQIMETILQNPISDDLGVVREEWLNFIRKEINAPSQSWIQNLRKSATIVCTTMTSADLQKIRYYDPPFDWVIIEEAGKAYLTELGLPLLCGNRWLLIGDQKQLPPYLQKELVEKLNICLKGLREDEFSSFSEEEFNEFRENLILDTKFFGHLYSTFENTHFYYAKSDECPVHRLKEQHRMIPVISNLIAKVFYHDNFDNFVEPLILIKEPQFLQDFNLVWIDTPPASYNRDAIENKSSSKSLNNPFEARIVAKILENLTFYNDTTQLQVLTPYQGQTDLLRNTLTDIHPQFRFVPDEQINTVDSYQGKESDIVILSLVRNNDYEDPRKALGFLLEPERLNVMFSRAKNNLIVIGSLKHIDVFSEQSSHEWQEIIAYFREFGSILDANDILKGGP